MWDRDPPAPPTLLRVKRNGKSIDAVSQTTKSGHVFVFNRGSSTGPAYAATASQLLEFGPDDILLANLPFFHVFGLTVNLWLPLERGMTMVTYPNPLEFRSICSAVREEKVTVMVGTPAFLTGYAQKSEPGDFATVRLLITGADRIARNGDTANKIGTYTKAVLAQRHGIPFYVAIPFSTIDWTHALAAHRQKSRSWAN